MSETVGRYIGSYQLARLLERGSVVERYLGKHVRTGALAEIKVFQGRARAEEDFQNESLRLARLEHPHLVPWLDFGTHAGIPFLVLEYVPDSLRQLYPAGARLPMAVVLEYVRQVGSALVYAHAQGIVHGDLKPEHLRLQQQDRNLLLSDLGIAALARSIEAAPVQPTPYHAPEQARGALLPASDQYALARVVYEWLSGERTTRDAPPSLQVNALTLPALVEPVLRTALVESPGQRFGSMLAFINALEQASQDGLEQPRQPLQPVGRTAPQPINAGNDPVKQPIGSPVRPLPAPAALAGPTPPSTPGSFPLPQQVPGGPLSAPGQFQRQHGLSRRALLIGGGAGLAALGIGGSLAFLKLSGRLSAPALIPPTLVSTQPDQYSLDDSFLWSPDSTRIATISGTGPSATVNVWNAVDGGHASSWSPGKGAWNLIWTENNPHAAGGDNQQIHIVDIVSKKEIATYTSPVGVKGGLWSPNGRRLASINETITDTSAGGIVTLWDALTGANLATFTAPVDGQKGSFSNNSPQIGFIWSPDSTSLLSWGYNGILYVIDAQNGAQISTYRKHWEEHVHESNNDQIFIDTVEWSPDSQRLVTSGHGEKNTDNTLHVWNARNGQEICVYTGHLGQGFNRVTWSPDGQLIASLGQDGFIRVWDATTAAQVFVHPADPEKCLTWEPGKRRIASSTGRQVENENASFHVWDATTGANDFTYGAPASSATATVDPTSANGGTSYLGAEFILWSPDGQLIAALDDNVASIWKGGR